MSKQLLRRELKLAAVDLRRNALIVGSEVGQPADRLMKVEDFVRGKAGKGGGFVQVTMRDMGSQNTLTHKFSTDDRVETVELEKPTSFTLLYRDEEFLYLMEEETMDQIEVPLSIIDAQQARWLQDTMQLKVSKYDGAPFMVNIPGKATFEVTESPAAKSGENLKLVTLENGEKVRVPTYIEAGEQVVVNTADGTFSSRP